MTTVFGHTAAISARLLTTSPGREASRTSRSKARAPIGSGRPSRSSTRCAGSSSKSRKAILVSAGEPESMVSLVSRWLSRQDVRHCPARRWAGARIFLLLRLPAAQRPVLLFVKMALASPE